MTVWDRGHRDAGLAIDASAIRQSHRPFGQGTRGRTAGMVKGERGTQITSRVSPAVE